jgi:hypothetical protein
LAIRPAAQRTPEEQVAYLRAACGEDEDLRLRVQRLLDAQPQLGSFLQRPAASLVAVAAPGAYAINSLITWPPN